MNNLSIHPLLETKEKETKKLQIMSKEETEQFDFDYVIKQAEREEI